MWPAVIASIVAVMGTAQDWSGVAFGRGQFEQVEQFAVERMLDPPVPGTPREQYAWRHGAELALWNSQPLVDLVPTTYLEILAARGWQPAEVPQPLVCNRQPVDGLVLVREAVWDRDKPSLKLAWQAWHGAHSFGKTELFCVLGWIDGELARDDLHQARSWAAWVNAASGWLKGLDKHSDVLAARYWDRVSQPDQEAPQADLGFAVTPCAADLAACCVADVREGSAAWKADLRVGDRLRTPDFAPCATPAVLQGDVGTKVTLRLITVLKHKPRTVTLYRDFAVAHDVSSELLQPGFVRVRLSDFVKGTAGRLRTTIAAAAKGKGKNALRGVVLDMRDNTGGVLDEAVAIADLLLPSGVIFKARWHGKPDQQPTASAAADDVRLPVVVLVNRMCASACEVLTGALQDHGRALVIGEHTLGKASMQRIAKPSLMAGFYVKATIGHYWTPKDRDLDGVGARPDVALPAQASTRLNAPEPWQPVVQCVAKQGRAPQRLAADVAPRRRPDPWLAMAQDLASCMPRP